MTQPPDTDEPETRPAAPPPPPAAAPEPAPADLDAVVGMASPDALRGVAVAGAAAPAVDIETSPVRDTFARRRQAAPDALTDPATRPALAAYVLLVGVVLTLGAGLLPALYLAWRDRRTTAAWLRSHHIYLLRTIWTTAAAGLAGLITVPVGLGVFVLTLTAVWCVLRAAAGLLRLMKGRAIDHPRTWTLPWSP